MPAVFHRFRLSIIPAGSIFETKANGMTAKVDLLETTAGEQEAAESEGLSATDVKGSERKGANEKETIANFECASGRACNTVL